jgi:hypothetical protein
MQVKWLSSAAWHGIGKSVEHVPMGYLLVVVRRWRALRYLLLLI